MGANETFVESGIEAGADFFSPDKAIEPANTDDVFRSRQHGIAKKSRWMPYPGLTGI